MGILCQSTGINYKLLTLCVCMQEGYDLFTVTIKSYTILGSGHLTHKHLTQSTPSYDNNLI